VTGGANAEITDSAHPEATVRAAESHVITLRPVQDGDLDVLFAHQADPVAAEMAAFPARDRPQFDAHWARIRLDPAVVTRTILADGVVAGNIGCWADGARWLVGYWIGREHWGRAVATRALAQFLAEVPNRPLYAHVAAHNAGSIRVLQKCGFRRDHVQEARLHHPEDGVDELLFVLEQKHHDAGHAR